MPNNWQSNVISLTHKTKTPKSESQIMSCFDPHFVRNGLFQYNSHPPHVRNQQIEGHKAPFSSKAAKINHITTKLPINQLSVCNVCQCNPKMPYVRYTWTSHLQMSRVKPIITGLFPRLDPPFLSRSPPTSSRPHTPLCFNAPQYVW